VTIGFRANDHDKELLARLAHAGETTTEVLRRALEALERLEWERQAQTDARRIMATGEDLGQEADAW
jgi:hypothetical protein